jgi:hypothetical protein
MTLGTGKISSDMHGQFSVEMATVIDELITTTQSAIKSSILPTNKQTYTQEGTKIINGINNRILR